MCFIPEKNEARALKTKVSCLNLFRMQPFSHPLYAMDHFRICIRPFRCSGIVIQIHVFTKLPDIAANRAAHDLCNHFRRLTAAFYKFG